MAKKEVKSMFDNANALSNNSLILLIALMLTIIGGYFFFGKDFTISIFVSIPFLLVITVAVIILLKRLTKK